jgi:DNA polymerase-1
MGKHDFFPTLRKYKRYKKLREYVEKWTVTHINGYIHANFNLQTVETGRLSSSDPNLQNVPKPDETDPEVPNLRDAFIVEEDEIMLSADYSQGEYRLAAVLYEDEWLLDQFRQGRKFHHEMALALFGEGFSKKQYTYAKNTNFGILYGETPNGLAYNLNIPIKEADRIINEWFARCPGVRAGMDDIERQIKENGYLTSYFGRKRRFWFWTRETWMNILREGYNFPLQSALSDLMLLSLIELTPMLAGRARPIITVHDSLTFAVKRPYLEEVARTVVEVMMDTPFSDTCPFTVELSIGERWGSEDEYLLAS